MQRILSVVLIAAATIAAALLVRRLISFAERALERRREDRARRLAYERSVDLVALITLDAELAEEVRTALNEWSKVRTLDRTREIHHARR